jgi:hypothetical protein
MEFMEIVLWFIFMHKQRKVSKKANIANLFKDPADDDRYIRDNWKWTLEALLGGDPSIASMRCAHCAYLEMAVWIILEQATVTYGKLRIINGVHVEHGTTPSPMCKLENWGM